MEIILILILSCATITMIAVYLERMELELERRRDRIVVAAVAGGRRPRGHRLGGWQGGWRDKSAGLSFYPFAG